MTERSTVERIADWSAELRLAAVPDAVVALTRAQRASVLGAIAGSAEDQAATRLVDAVLAQAADGPAPVMGRDRTVRVEDALVAASAASIALDFDDYGLFGHSGHSAVLVPLLLAAETGADGPTQLEAQIVANEVALRLGGACLLGPLNGQLWSFIHTAAAALAAGRLLGLDRAQLAQALAIALYQAPRPTVPGFMAPDSKLLTAADPTLTGMRAARLAAGGVTGPLDTLDHPQGFLGAFAFAPLTGMLGGLGEGWASRTLCIKPYPGCAYVDTTLDALLSLGPIDPDAVERIDVAAGLMTCGMDGLSREYATRGVPTPVTVTFSVPWNVAIALVAGELTPAQVNHRWLAENAAQLEALTRRVHLEQSWELSRRTLDAVVPLLSPRAIGAELGTTELLGALRRLRGEHRSVATPPGQIVAFLRWLASSGRGADFRFWDDESLRRFRMTFPARVRVTLRDGRTLEAERDVPRGGAGHGSEDPIAVGETKLRTLGPGLWGEEGTARIESAIASDDARLWALLG